jgi:lipase
MGDFSVKQAVGCRVTREAQGKVRGDGVELAFGYWPGYGMPIVALHGLTASYLNFIGMAECLAGRRAVLALDLRGRGNSDKPDASYGMAQHARDVAAAMRAMGIGPSVIVGHSMGAFVAAALAAQEPALVAGVVLIDGGYVPALNLTAASDTGNSGALLERVAQLRETYPSRQAYIDYWRSKPHFPQEDWGPWIEALLGYEVTGETTVSLKARESGVRADLMEGFQVAQISARLRAIRVPAVLIRAEAGFLPGQPPLFSDAMAEEIRKLTPQIQDHKFTGTTHYTLVLGTRGASQISDLVDDFARLCDTETPSTTETFG